MSETKTLQERLRGVAEKFAVIHEERNRENTDVMVDEEVVFNACCRLDEAADALDAKDALLREARGELGRMVEHFGIWADDHPTDATTETWGALHCARALLAKLIEATK